MDSGASGSSASAGASMRTQPKDAANIPDSGPSQKVKKKQIDVNKWKQTTDMTLDAFRRRTQADPANPMDPFEQKKIKWVELLGYDLELQKVRKIKSGAEEVLALLEEAEAETGKLKAHKFAMGAQLLVPTLENEWIAVLSEADTMRREWSMKDTLMRDARESVRALFNHLKTI